MKITHRIVAVVLLSLILSVPAFGAGPQQAPGDPLLDQVLQVSNAYFQTFPFTRAEDVYEKIVKGNDESWFLVSVQTPREYATGHVPGALNIPLSEITDPKWLKLLPRDRNIVFTCDDGHRSMAAALFFGQMGYKTSAMSMGLGYWNRASSGVVAPYNGSAGYPVTIDVPEAPASSDLPAVKGAESGKDFIVKRTKDVLSSEKSLFIDRKEVYEKIVKPGSTDSVIVALTRAEDYAKGHLPGSINIPYHDMAKPESLRKLPRDKKIILVCYVGHWGTSAAVFLRQLGYDAYDMRFGTLGWNDTTDGLGEGKGYIVSLGGSKDFPVEKGQGVK